MNAAIDQERRRLEARSRYYQREMRRAARGLRSALPIAPLALNAARRMAPALPYVLAAAAIGVVVLQLRARSAPRALLIGGVIVDALRIWSLRGPARGAAQDRRLNPALHAAVARTDWDQDSRSRPG